MAGRCGSRRAVVNCNVFPWLNDPRSRNLDAHDLVGGLDPCPTLQNDFLFYDFSLGIRVTVVCEESRFLKEEVHGPMGEHKAVPKK